MYGIEMKHTVKTLLDKGLSQRAISRELGISRKTVKKYFDEIQTGNPLSTPVVSRERKLDAHRESIKDWLSQGLTGVLILEKLQQKGVCVSYPSVSRFLKEFKTQEVYIPLISKPAEEAQVDFGYLGRYLKDGK